jgi:hypothetical protein
MLNFMKFWGKDNLVMYISHLAKQLQRRRYLEIDQLETRMACGGHVY